MHSCLAKGQEKRLLFLCFQVDRMPVSAAKRKPTKVGINGARGYPWDSAICCACQVKSLR